MNELSGLNVSELRETSLPQPKPLNMLQERAIDSASKGAFSSSPASTIYVRLDEAYVLGKRT
jgi:hypothetical protein